MLDSRSGSRSASPRAVSGISGVGQGPRTVHGCALTLRAMRQQLPAHGWRRLGKTWDMNWAAWVIRVGPGAAWALQIFQDCSNIRSEGGDRPNAVWLDMAGPEIDGGVHMLAAAREYPMSPRRRGHPRLSASACWNLLTSAGRARADQGHMPGLPPLII